MDRVKYALHPKNIFFENYMKQHYMKHITY